VEEQRLQKRTPTKAGVSFGDVDASSRNGIVTVNWSTLTETNNNHFEIQTSANGKTLQP